MKHILILMLVVLASIQLKAQSVDVSSKYELHIKDQKMLDAFTICFRNFDEYTKANQWDLFKIYLSYISADEIYLKIDLFSQKDTIQYRQPDNYVKFGDKIVFIYSVY